jgi:hypothetical protein
MTGPTTPGAESFGRTARLRLASRGEPVPNSSGDRDAQRSRKVSVLSHHRCNISVGHRMIQRPRNLRRSDSVSVASATTCFFAEAQMGRGRMYTNFAVGKASEKLSAGKTGLRMEGCVGSAGPGLADVYRDMSSNRAGSHAKDRRFIAQHVPRSACREQCRCSPNGVSGRSHTGGEFKLQPIVERSRCEWSA